MNTQLKRQVVFTLGMGLVTTGIISFVLVVMNLGFSTEFASAWVRSWVVAYVIVIPIILVVSPRLNALLERLIQ